MTAQKFALALTLAFLAGTSGLASAAGNNPNPNNCQPPSGPPAKQDAEKVKIKVPAEKTKNLSYTPDQGPQGEGNRQDYAAKVSEALKAAGAQVAECTSAYRSPEEQAAACKKICGGAASCPGKCAAPCKSQHQKPIAVCDLKGISKNAKEGCQKLKEICDKFGGKCGIGGYGGDAYHFGINDDHFSAWNQCGFLSGSGAAASSTAARANAQSARIRR